MAVVWTERREPSDAEREAVARLVARGVVPTSEGCADVYLDRFSLAEIGGGVEGSKGSKPKGGGAMRSKVHVSGDDGYAACGARSYVILTNVPRGITCGACRRTRAYRDRRGASGERARHADRADPRGSR